MLVVGFAAQATLQTGIRIQGFTRTNGTQTQSAGIISSIWYTQQLPVQSGSSYTFNNQSVPGDVTVTLNGTINFQEATALTDVVTSSSLTVTLESASTSNPYWFYGATVKTGSGATVSGCTATVSSDRRRLTVTIPSGKTFSYIYIDYVTNEPLSSSNTTLSGIDASYIYKGSAIEPVPTVTYCGSTLTAGTDYTVSYTGSNSPGTATVTVTGTGDYAGTVTKNYTIRNIALSDFNSLGNNTYEIATTDDLDNLALLVDFAANDCSGLTFKQTADIAYNTAGLGDTDANFTAIGGYFNGSDKNFSGTYDGQDHTISGIRLYKPLTNQNVNKNQALFGRAVNATIKNVTITDTRITGYRIVAGLVGNCNGSTVQNCLVLNSTITCGDTYVGAVIGQNNNGTFTANYYRGCTVNGTVGATNVGVGGNGSVSSSSDRNGVRSVHTLTLPTGVTASGESVDIDGVPHYAAASTVTLSYGGDVPEGYTLVYSVNGSAITGNTFTMPRQNATVTMTTTAIDYTITLPTNPEHFTVTSDKATAHMGETVTLTVTPDNGCIIQMVTVMNGNTPVEVIAGENNTYTFTMPAANVTVTIEVLLRYIFNSQTGALTLVWGEFNKDYKWGTDVQASAVKSVTATSEVSFTGKCDKLFNQFTHCESMDLSNVNTAGMTGAYMLFASSPSLTSLNLSGWNTGNITSMRYMFAGCSGLTMLDLSGWNTSNVIGMSYMFYGCSGLTSLDLSGWNTANVTDMNYMFYNCSSLDTLDLAGWNTGNVTDMSDMFYGCSNLATIYAGKEWNTENVTISGGMFSNCTSLVGGMSTTFDPDHTNAEYARYDHGYDEPGYLTGVFTLILPEDVTTTTAATLTHNGVNYYKAGSDITLSYNGTPPENMRFYHFTVGGEPIDGDIFAMPFADAEIGVELQARYTFDSTTGELALIWGEFNKNNKWGNDVNKNYVTSITATDEVSFTGDCTELFWDFTNCTSMDLSNVNTDSLTNAMMMFENCQNLESLNLSGWNTASVTNMQNMFSSCPRLNSLDITGWNTANVTNMINTFGGCSSLKTLDLSGWNTASVTNMNGMFACCDSLKTIDFSGWNTASVTNMSLMFYQCFSLETLDLTGWNTASVTNMHSMFEFCSSLQSLNLIGWNTASVTNMSNMFHNCESLTSLDLSGWNTAAVTNMSFMFSYNPSLTSLDLSNWNTAKVTDMGSMFYGCSNLATIYAGKEWNTENVTSSGSMFTGCTSLVGGMSTTYDPNHTDGEYARYDHGDDEPGYLTGVFALILPEDVTTTTAATLTHNGVNYYKSGSEVTLSYSGEVPEGYAPVYSVNGNAIQGDTFDMPFEDATVTVEVQRLRYIYDSETHELALIFGPFNKDNKWGDDVPIDSVTSVTATDEVSFTGDCSQLFYNFTNCTSMDLSKVNTDSVTKMSVMFAGCSSLDSLDISSWNTANVTNMGIMFNGCSSLKTLDLSSWDVSNVTNIGNMFQSCQSLESLNLSGWNTSSVTNMSNMFENCTGLESLNLSGWDISNIANVGVIFSGCTSLTTLDVSGWTIGSASIWNLFMGCTGITTLDLSTWNTAGVTNMYCMFVDCANLATIYVGEGWTTENVTNSDRMFGGCTSLVGGMGTVYDPDHVDAEYAHIDGGPDCPGYFTEKPAGKPGDVNGDGEVDVRDITALIDVIMNSITDNPRADVNGDGDNDVRDITALIDIIMNS